MLKPPQTSYAGKLNLQLRVEGYESDDDHFLWQTDGESSVNILKELDGEPVIPITPDIVDQFLTEASQLVQEAKEYSESASSSAQR